eukprot:gene1577-1722_t
MITSLLNPALPINGKKYKILSKLGEGGFSMVYRVKSLHDNAPYDHFALKKMLCQTPEQLADCKKEIEAMMQVSHPCVIPLLGHTFRENNKQQDSGEAYLLLPLYATSAQHIIDNGRGFPYSGFSDGLDVLNILHQCVEGLIAIHAAGYRHGDLKPANILLAQDGHAVLTDLGSVEPIEQYVRTRADALVIQDRAATLSTASYRAPELFEPCPPDMIINGKADVWAIGCLIYAFYFSRTPFESPVEGLSKLAVMSGRYSLPAIHPWPVDHLNTIENCLKPELEFRLGLKELQQEMKLWTCPMVDLSTAAASLTPPVPPATVPAATSPPSPVFNEVPSTSGEDGVVSSTKQLELSTVPSASTVAAVPEMENMFADFSLAPSPSTATAEEPHSYPNVSQDPFDEFGDFEGVAVTEIAQVVPTTPIVPFNAFGSDEDISIPKNEVEVNMFYNLSEQAKKESCIIKQGSVQTLRPTGLTKKIIKKTVWLVLTKEALILRKESTPNSKIHLVLTFSRPLHLTASDTSDIGLNGLITRGSNVLPANDKVPSSLLEEVTLNAGFGSKEELSEWIDAIEEAVQAYLCK